MHTLTKNPAILYQGVPFFCSFARFSAHLDEKTAISLPRSTKATASRHESRGRHSFFGALRADSLAPGARERPQNACSGKPAKQGFSEHAS